jgi:hypothetical protein
MDMVGLLQWPAMVVTLAASWLVASSHTGKRNVGFWMFLLSNVLWVAWGLHSQAPALIVLQLGLAALNIRGAMKTEAAK